MRGCHALKCHVIWPSSCQSLVSNHRCQPPFPIGKILMVCCPLCFNMRFGWEDTQLCRFSKSQFNSLFYLQYSLQINCSTGVCNIEASSGFFGVSVA